MTKHRALDRAAKESLRYLDREIAACGVSKTSFGKKIRIYSPLSGSANRFWSYQADVPSGAVGLVRLST
jgi:hypothetical protein